MRFTKISVMQQLEYRLDFFISILVECVFLLSKLTYVYIIFQADVEIKGLSHSHIMLFIGTFILMTAIFTCLFMDNFYDIPRKVERGDLDLLMMRPISLQFYLTFQNVNLALFIPNMIAGTVLIVLGWIQLGLSTAFVNFFVFFLLILIGVLLTYTVFQIPHILSFWIIKTEGIIIIADRLWDFNNMPMLIYNKWIQRIGIFIIPVFVITNFPFLSVLNRLTLGLVIWAILAAILFMILLRLLWSRALKRYCSAGG